MRPSVYIQMIRFTIPVSSGRGAGSAIVLAHGRRRLIQPSLETMSSFTTSLIGAASIFAGAILGMGLQRRLPSHHLSKEMQDLVKLSAGTIATLTALVLGLLVSSAKSSFDGIQTGIVQGSAKFILLDRALARYGPESKAAREQLKRVVAAGIEMVWADGENRGVGFDELGKRQRHRTCPR